MARLGHVAVIFVAGCAAVGCVSPLLHPLRVPDGPVAEVAGVVLRSTGAGPSCAPHAECSSSSGSWGISPAASVGYGHVFARRFGVMGGIWGAATSNQGVLKQGTVLDVAALYSYFTYQPAGWSIGLGPSLSRRGLFVTAGFDHILLDEQTSLGIYQRWFQPWHAGGGIAQEDGLWLGGVHPIWDFGVRARLNRFYTQCGGFLATSGYVAMPVGIIIDYARWVYACSVGWTFGAVSGS
jgi:hypothetical protein